MLCPRGSKVLNTPPLKLPGGWVGTVTCREEAREAQVCVCGPYGSERSIVMRRGAGEEGGGLAGVSRDLRLGREEPGSGRGRTGGGGPVTSGAGREGSQGRLPALVFGGQGRKEGQHTQHRVKARHATHQVVDYKHLSQCKNTSAYLHTTVPPVITEQGQRAPHNPHSNTMPGDVHMTSAKYNREKLHPRSHPI